MNIKFCTQCKVYKPIKEFYNSHTMADGKQNKCKECSKKNNKKFHIENPDYYWGKNGYFTQRYEETIQYVSNRNKADKSCKIYVIYVDDQIYIGSSKTHLKRIKNNLKRQYDMTKYYPTEKSTRLGEVLRPYSKNNAYALIENLVIIKEFDGTKEEMRDVLIDTIKEYRNQGKKIINKFYE